jgi:hypothetical protein
MTSTVQPPSPSRKTPLPTNEQYKLLRSRLDKLGYFDLFTPESMALVMRLLNDLVQTTDSCKKLKLGADSTTQERRRLESEVGTCMKSFVLSFISSVGAAAPGNPALDQREQSAA